jgi:hypothetical protein
MANVSINCSHIADGVLPSVCIRCGKPAVTKRFSWVQDPALARRYLGRKGLLMFWVFILSKGQAQPASGESDAGLPFCTRHRNSWVWRAWFLVGGCVLFWVLLGLAVATDPSFRTSSRNVTPKTITGVAGAWFVFYAVGFAIVHTSSMRVIRHDGLRVTLVGVSKQFVAALKSLLPGYSEDKRPTHWEELRQMVSDYNR